MIIIGQYEQDFGQPLRAKIEEEGLHDTAEIIGFMDYSRGMELAALAATGLSILKPVPNYTFCLSGKTSEYIMCGTPVLAPNFEHLRAYVEGEKVGKTVDPSNIDEIVCVCEQMLMSPKELAAMGKRGIEAVRSQCNWSTESKELLRCYEELLNG